MLGVIVITGLEAMPPPGDNAIIIVGMDDPSPAELVLVVGSIEVLARFTKKSQGVWSNVGEPSRGVSRPRVTGHTLNNSQRACCFGVGFRETLGSCRHWLLLPGRPCLRGTAHPSHKIGRASCRERMGQYV